MRMILKSALAVAAMAGATTLVPTMATAGVAIGIGVPVAAPYGYPPYGYAPYGAGYAPYGAGYASYDDPYYYAPIFISGSWYHGPYRWRMWQGERMFFVNGRWHRNEWRGGPRPASFAFRNGGYFRDGRYEGFGGAERINARFRSGNSDMREDRRDLDNERSGVRDDRGDMRQDQRDRRDDIPGVGHDRDNNNNDN